jgi:DNA-binding MarR family transcriptional regulator
MPISITDQLSPLDATEERAWRALAYFFVTAPRILDEDLQRGARMSLSAYTILMHLSEAPERTLRITELASRAYLSGSRTTRLVDELVAAGYATKQRCTTDGRGFDVGLTENGLTALEHAYPIHLCSVRSRVLDHVDQSAMPCFTEVLTSIASTLEGLPRQDRGSCQSDPASQRGASP